MKLNMWMIVNRLKNYEIEKRLDQNAPATLNSTLPVYKPGCVRITADGSDVLCENGEEYIRIHDMPLNDGYMLIQSIFDWYQDWMERVDAAVMNGKFQQLVEICSQGFGNPVMLQDSNYRLLGMTEGFTEGQMPKEWAYIRENGQSSVEGYGFMMQALHSVGGGSQAVCRFRGISGDPIPCGGLHAAVSFQGREYGKLTVLEYRRAMNQGDVRLLEVLTRRMSIYNAAISGYSAKFLDTQTLEALIAEQAVEQETITYFEGLIKNGGSGRFAVMTLQFADKEGDSDRHAMQLLKNLIREQHPDTASCIYQAGLVLLLVSPATDALANQITKYAECAGFLGRLRAGVSLPFSDLTETSSFYRQSVYALRACICPGLTAFYDVALQVLLSSIGPERILACEPEMRQLWDSQPEKRENLRSLGVYLDMERSCTLAARQLFIHKNTLTYRIRVLKEETGWDLDQAYVRNYLRMSLYCLEQSK